MSKATNQLLQRSGRDQFGNKGTPTINHPSFSKSDELARVKHEQLNILFLEKYKKQWLALFNTKNKKDTYKILYPYGKPSLATFYKKAKEFNCFEDYLYYLLLANKKRYLSLLDLPLSDITKELSSFEDCGRYSVDYKGVGGIFTR